MKKDFIKFGEFFKLHGGKFLILFWVYLMLCCLGALKILHMIITQELKMDFLINPLKVILAMVKQLASHVCKERFPAFYDNCCSTIGKCFRICCRRCCWAISCGRVSKIRRVMFRRRIERGWRAPPYCNGMCDGAKFRRSLHRRLMRVMKRTGQKKDTPWFSKKYICTCKVKDTMPCLKILKGLFFFFYCPLLPLYWSLEFFCIYLKRKWRRWKRIRAYRVRKEEKEAKKQQQYLHMDDYSRGILEKEMVTLDKELKEIRQLEKEYEITVVGSNVEQEELQLEVTSDREGRNMSSEAALSDTSDPDQANDIDELLKPGYPVYFNYAFAKKSHGLTVRNLQLRLLIFIFPCIEFWKKLQLERAPNKEIE